MIKLNSLKPNSGSVKNKTRVGRGQGSGGGGTAKRGHKGAKSRSGYSQKKGFEGGQMPLQRRVPKFGFNNPNKVVFKAINLDTLQDLADNYGVSAIDLGVLYNAGLIQKSDSVKILGRGELSAVLEVKVNAFSKSAVEALEKVGGKAIVDSTFNPEASADLRSQKKASAPVQKAEAPKAEKKATAKKAAASGDDLKKIEGVGPKIAELLQNAGLDSFAAVAGASVETLQQILSEAGSRYASHNPTTWPEQAALAADGKWDELKELQDKLNGGRPE
ncbi:50S ribosomal protein L15 [Marinilongibacter aquaticus]|uniref:50S ribosomal protein L15 n=1 Tax=Marinilongibacter aquaticus TaxID=2975157 RepID=UPI00286E6669|nr:50S ribosomal protein L15 [Marinilongibacter aquaticus]